MKKVLRQVQLNKQETLIYKMGGQGSGRIADPNKQFLKKEADIVRITQADTPLVIPNYSGDMSQGNVQDTPVDSTDIPNKAYVDASAGGTNHNILSATHTDSTAAAASQGSVIIGDGTPKWTELIIGGANEVLTSDGTDVAWAAATGDDLGDHVATQALDMASNNISGANIISGAALYTSGNITTGGTVDGIDIATDVAANTLKDTNVSTDLSAGTRAPTTIDVNSSDGSNATLVEADTTNAGILGSDKWDEIVANSVHTAGDGSDHSDVATNTADITNLSGAAWTHMGDSSDPHGATLTQTGIVSSGTVSGAAIQITADKTISGAATVLNTIFGTDVTPPAASGFTQGSIYVQYTP